MHPSSYQHRHHHKKKKPLSGSPRNSHSSEKRQLIEITASPTINKFCLPKQLHLCTSHSRSESTCWFIFNNCQPQDRRAASGYRYFLAICNLFALVNNCFKIASHINYKKKEIETFEKKASFNHRPLPLVSTSASQWPLPLLLLLLLLKRAPLVYPLDKRSWIMCEDSQEEGTKKNCQVNAALFSALLLLYFTLLCFALTSDDEATDFVMHV